MSFFLFFLPPLLFSPLLHNPLLALFPQGKCTAVHIVEEGSAPGIIPPLSPSLPPCRNERNKNYSRAFLGKEEGGWGGRRLCGIERERGKGREGWGRYFYQYSTRSATAAHHRCALCILTQPKAPTRSNSFHLLGANKKIGMNFLCL